MANLQTTEDIVKDAEFKLGELTNGTSTLRANILDHMNRIQRSVCAGGLELNSDLNKIQARIKAPIIFTWAKSKFPFIFNLEPVEDSDTTSVTASVTANSTTVTLSSSHTASLENWHFNISDTDEVYRISAHTAGTAALTLDGAYVGDTDATAQNKLFKLVYDLSPSDGILQVAGPIVMYKSEFGFEEDAEIELIEETYFKRINHPRDVVERVPDKAGVLYKDDTTLTLQFNAYPENRVRCELPYVPIPSTLSVGGNDPIIPKDGRILLSELTCYYMQDGLNDDRALGHLKTAFGIWQALVQRNEKETKASKLNFGRTYPNRLRSPNRKRGKLVTKDGWPI